MEKSGTMAEAMGWLCSSRDSWWNESTSQARILGFPEPKERTMGEENETKGSWLESQPGASSIWTKSTPRGAVGVQRPGSPGLSGRGGSRDSETITNLFRCLAEKG